jgi:hypothetical protein
MRLFVIIPKDLSLWHFNYSSKSRRKLFMIHNKEETLRNGQFRDDLLLFVERYPWGCRH